MKTILDNWKFIYLPHAEVKKLDKLPVTAAEITAAGAPVYDVAVPGSLELDLMRLGILPDIREGENILAAQTLEDRHVWYFTSFEISPEEGFDEVLTFGGIDTAAEVYIDGRFAGASENMFVPFSVNLNALPAGTHEVVVHILPAGVYTAEFSLPPYCRALKYNLEQLKIRKAPYMYGWDIMPRCVSAGLWQPVTIEKRPHIGIKDVFVRTVSLDDRKAVIGMTAEMNGTIPFGKMKLRFSGQCLDSRFEAETKVFGNTVQMEASVEKPYRWMPHNYGKPYLYDVKAELLDGEKELDVRSLKTGIRIVTLERTSSVSENGKFLFRVNGEKIYCMGTNWVPTDIFPAEQKKYDRRALEMVKDLGCNIIRCWGGNIYPDDGVFDFCDENGILVWQDFAMACGVYPDDERTCRLIKEEAEAVVRRLRNHASLALWSGDNECDQMTTGAIRLNGEKIHARKPDDNKLTRQVIPAVLDMLDNTRPYIPSSPYIDAEAYETGRPAEDHLWGPRDFFKGDYYKNAGAHFVSETGYHGCPSVTSLKRYIGEEHIGNIGNGKKCTDRQWILHCASPEPTPDSAYAYRIPLMIRQVERLFGSVSDELETFSLQSQISQAEAFKFFIEHSRKMKWGRSGVIWWNLIDGWPQISDAVVDWYGDKKLACEYIRVSQQPFLMLFDEPDENGLLSLYAVNDTTEKVSVSYAVKDVDSGVTAAEGSVTVEAGGTAALDKLPETDGVYRIEWRGENASGKNHFTCRIGETLDFEKHVSRLKKIGLLS